MQSSDTQSKSNAALREEAVLQFWKEHDIFQKTLTKEHNKGDFVFFEGPPTANAKPALHHLEARAFKDVIPRYKTMQGYHVDRRAGWDTHGLPVELQIEKALGLQSKKDIEAYGIAAFNKACKESVFTYIKDWETFTDRIGYWVDKSRAYYTFDTSYMESLWHIVGRVNEQGLLYKDYKVVPWCARCGTGLSSHELAQGYADVKDLSVYAKFKLLSEDNTYIIAWTTTPWTLPGNVALAIGNDITYVRVRVGDEIYIIARERLSVFGDTQHEVVGEQKGSELVGAQYEPLYPYLAEQISGIEKEKLAAAYKIYAADFVTTTDGTGVVHTAVMYGADDFELGTKVGLPKFHTVDVEGKFITGTDFLAGRFVKDEEVAIDIIKDLAHRGLLFKKEKYEHSYPHCWRCKTPLIYYARDSWYIAMEKFRDTLVAENEQINWEPAHIKDGRFGEWLRGIKDWAISRERYWGTPLPVWTTEQGDRIVIDSVAALRAHSVSAGNTYLVMRHGQTDHNLRQEWNCDRSTPDPLTELGVQQVVDTATAHEGDVDIIITSPYSRTKHSAELFANTKNLSVEILTDERIREWEVGSAFNNRPFDEYFKARNSSADRYNFKAPDGESYRDVLVRAGEFLYDLESKYQGKRILIVTHGAVARAIDLVARGYTMRSLFEATRSYQNFGNADLRQIDFVPLPHNELFELDLHRPYIDEVALQKDGIPLTRTKEVMDVWFDSGAMPFAQNHYPFAQKLPYPADFISEAIDQTRGWFYTLHAVGILMGKGRAYNNVICLGHLLDKDGKKMSKSIGNIVEPFEQINTFGVDAVRLWMYSVNQPGDSKNYDEKTVAQTAQQFFGLLYNVLSFYELYRDRSVEGGEKKEGESNHVLDVWILARLNQLVTDTATHLDNFKLFESVRAIRDFIDDLSTWYLRRSRDRIKDGDQASKRTLYTVLKTVAQVLAPFAPFAAEDIWQKLKTASDAESVHLSQWPEAKNFDPNTLVMMEQTRMLATLGNGLRKKLAIPVRQPLSNLKVEREKLKVDEAHVALVCDELNVKDVVWLDGITDAELDTDITPELKREGKYRELVRLIQDMRKEKGLAPQDVITLTLPSQYQEIMDTFGEDLKKVVGANNIFVEGSEIIVK